MSSEMMQSKTVNLYSYFGLHSGYKMIDMSMGLLTKQSDTLQVRMIQKIFQTYLPSLIPIAVESELLLDPIIDVIE